MQALRKLISGLTTSKAALASPTFTGVPVAPTAAPGTNTTQLATTAFVEARATLSGYRAPAANAALTLAAADSVVKIQSTNADTVVATMTATRAGHMVRVFLDVRSSTGSYTLAANRGGTPGTVTLNAAFEGVDLVYSGTAWEVVELFGGSTWA